MTISKWKALFPPRIFCYFSGARPQEAGAGGDTTHLHRFITS
ncbi:MAG: hypothetical protein UX90_C0002G0135 [Candidatus Wolfebacteria bacterium GW2011_GWD2_47_17]|nr:MAG: hypothetical protein UX90_C0002G0135 [Candidatus Wolfebacteria bacterium GW2011_GWD2_47_17]